MTQNKTNIYKRIFAVFAVFAVIMSAVPAVSYAAVFNNDSQDKPTLRVTNYSENASCNSCWSSEASGVDPGEVVSFVFYYHNTSNETARNTRANISFSYGNVITATGRITADSTSQVTGTATVRPSSQYNGSNMRLSFNSAYWYPNQNSSNSVQLPNGQTGSEVTGSGVNLGNIGPGWSTQGYLVVRFSVQQDGGSGSGNTPLVETAYPSSIGSTFATFRGRVNPRGSATTYRFEYGTTPSFGSVTNSFSLGSQDSFSDVSETISNLITNTTYYYRLVASNSHGISHGQMVNFITSGSSGGHGIPTVETEQAIVLSQGAITFRGRANPNGADTVAYFEYGTQPYSMTYTTNSTNIGSGSSFYSFSQTTSFSSNVTYYYRAVARNNFGTSFGQVLSVTPTGGNYPTNVPYVTTRQATYISKNSALLNADVNTNGSTASGWFEYGTTTSLGQNTSEQQFGSGTGTLPLSFALSGLNENTTYYFRAVARNQSGVGYGTILNFKTQGYIAPTPVYTPPVQTVVVERSGGSDTACVTLSPRIEDKLLPGETFTYVLAVKNDCSFELRSAKLRVTFPDAVSSVASGFSFLNEDGKHFTFTIGSLPRNFQLPITIQGVLKDSVDRGDELDFGSVFTFIDNKGRSQSFSAFLKAMVEGGNGIGFSAFTLGIFTGVLPWVLLIALIVLIILTVIFAISRMRRGHHGGGNGKPYSFSAQTEV